MTKSEFAAKVAEKAGISKKAAAEAVDAVLTTITEALEEGEKVSFVGFGTFEVRTRAARQGINPRTKETISIPASKLPVFKAGRGLKDIVAK